MRYRESRPGGPHDQSRHHLRARRPYDLDFDRTCRLNHGSVHPGLVCGLPPRQAYHFLTSDTVQENAVPRTQVYSTKLCPKQVTVACTRYRVEEGGQVNEEIWPWVTIRPEFCCRHVYRRMARIAGSPPRGGRRPGIAAPGHERHHQDRRSESAA